MGCAVNDDAQSDVSCQPVDRAHSVGLAWEDHCFLWRSAGHPPRTCCASCRHVLQQPKFRSFAVMCLLRTRVTKMLHCGLLSRATKRPHPKLTVFHRFALAGCATDVTRYRTSTHPSYRAAVRAFSAIMTRDMSSARGTALAFMDSAHASSIGRRAVFQPQSRDLGMDLQPFRGYKASHPKAWRGGVSLFSLFLGLSVWPKWPPVGLERHWQTPCIMVSGVSTPSA